MFKNGVGGKKTMNLMLSNIATIMKTKAHISSNYYTNQAAVSMQHQVCMQSICMHYKETINTGVMIDKLTGTKQVHLISALARQMARHYLVQIQFQSPISQGRLILMFNSCALIGRHYKSTYITSYCLAPK